MKKKINKLLIFGIKKNHNKNPKQYEHHKKGE